MDILNKLNGREDLAKVYEFCLENAPIDIFHSQNFLQGTAGVIFGFKSGTHWWGDARTMLMAITLEQKTSDDVFLVLKTTYVEEEGLGLSGGGKNWAKKLHNDLITKIKASFPNLAQGSDAK